MEDTLALVSREYPRAVEGSGAEGGLGLLGLLEEEEEAVDLLLDLDPLFFPELFEPFFLSSTPPNKASLFAAFSRLCFGPLGALEEGGPNSASRLALVLLL